MKSHLKLYFRYACFHIRLRVSIIFRQYQSYVNIYLPVTEGMKNKTKFIDGMELISLAHRHKRKFTSPSPAGSVDIDTRLQLNDANSTPMHACFLCSYQLK